MTSTADFLEAWGNEDKGKKGADSGGSGYVPVPEGDNTGILKAVEGRTNEKGQTVIFRYYFPAQNTEETEYVDLKPQTVKVLKAKLLSLGQEIPKSGELDAVVAAFRPAVGYTLRIKKKSTRKASGTGWYRDYRIEEVLDKTASPVVTKDSGGFDDGSLPF